MQFSVMSTAVNRVDIMGRMNDRYLQRADGTGILLVVLFDKAFVKLVPLYLAESRSRKQNDRDKDADLHVPPPSFVGPNYRFIPLPDGPTLLFCYEIRTSQTDPYCLYCHAPKMNDRCYAIYKTS